jgi:enoyl-CoA hydratase
METLTVEVDDRLAVVTVDRPEVRNALSRQVLAELRDVLADLRERDDVGLVAFTGAGDKAFVAGADIKYMQSLGVLEARRWGELGQGCANLLETIPKPTIAAINGYALGGGCELALACDIRIASREAKLGQPEVNLGIIPGWGGSQRLPRIVGLGFAKEIVFSGRAVGAQEAHDWGLVNQIYDPAELMPAAMKLAHELAKKSPLALAYAKEATNLYLTGEASAHMETELRLFAMLFSSEDQKEGMAAFAEKREPEFRGR